VESWLGGCEVEGYSEGEEYVGLWVGMELKGGGNEA
jgi:hypothetical protein